MRTWAKIGLLSFGGPTAQIALMHKIIVEEKKWLDESRYLNALNFCMLLPGPEAMQLATYSGWRLHGVRGGLAAGLLFVLPGAFVILALAAIYQAYGKVPLVETLFFGVKAAVTVIVIEALMRIAKRALKGPEQWATGAAAFVAIFFLELPFPLVVLTAALVGYFGGSSAASAGPSLASVGVPVGSTLLTILTWLLIWFVPLLLIALAFGGGHVLTQIGIFFSKMAMVTFGGAYAVLDYVRQDAVQHYRWIDSEDMTAGLGLAETTPGPLILVTEFVGYLAAYRHGGGNGFLMGTLGAIVTVWATFAPCFLWIFAGAPYVEWLNGQPRLKSALAAITAAVVGVILNLSIWFALHIFFGVVKRHEIGILKVWTPELASLDWRAVAIAIVAGVALLRLHYGIVTTLVLSCALALALRLAGLG
ncbi:MAG: chromate efflux transporter [Hyphomicrobiaceae bacterium]|nr:MAG: chromate efflux transporter [Hyphomicrobiaceae bacterium]